ncbi:hypothetical protein [Paenibacillus sp. GP183]|uniref:hypothetical protein n=1 Tax=Paenibacillus sp. GP183 TaxID=1882751 RepID=UPI0008993AB1|nr:hypothetical protein [Paenibacillus sp. GP183]SEB67246.1 hypothetical protein SAMN05443246_1527 [Paenibacillus sp. GP183]
MIIDYHEAETKPDGELSIHVGIQFEDEPDSLYVIHISVDVNGWVKAWTLLYNGVDCKYNFKPEEKVKVLAHLSEAGMLLQERKKG